MKNLLKAEWFKLSRSLGFKALCLYNAASLLMVLFLVLAGAKGTGYDMLLIALSYVFHHGVTGYMFAAGFLCKEFSDRTFGMALSCGASRRKVFAAKALVFLAGLLLLFLIYTGTATFIASIANGFGKDYSADILFLTFCGLLGCIAMGSVMLLTAVIAKKTVVTIGVGIGITYSLLLGRTHYLQEGVFPFIKYTYAYHIQELQFWGNGFSTEIFLVVMLLTIVIALVLAGFIFERAELR